MSRMVGAFLVLVCGAAVAPAACKKKDAGQSGAAAPADVVATPAPDVASPPPDAPAADEPPADAAPAEPDAGPPVKLPEVVAHPAPTGEVDLSAFLEHGCGSYPKTGWECAPTSPVTELCHSPEAPPPEFAALTPAVPMLTCRVDAGGSGHIDPRPGDPRLENLQDGRYMARGGCRHAMASLYVALREGQVTAVRTPAQFRDLVAPIESPEEALAYAIAITGGDARYTVELRDTFRYFVDKIEGSHVVRVDDAFEVNLFDMRHCGCGTPATAEYRYRVWPDGRIAQLGEPTKVWENPMAAGCYD